VVFQLDRWARCKHLLAVKTMIPNISPYFGLRLILKTVPRKVVRYRLDFNGYAED
jgi:hypothetical protein